MWLRVFLILFLAAPAFGAQPPKGEQTFTVIVKTSRSVGEYASPEVALPDDVSEIIVRIERPSDPAIIYAGRIEWSTDQFATFNVCQASDVGGLLYGSTAAGGKGTFEPYTLIACKMPPAAGRRARGFLTISAGNHNTAVEITVR